MIGVRIFGTATREDDPFYDDIFDRYNVVKVIPVAELPATIKRWNALGRTIDRTVAIEMGE